MVVHCLSARRNKVVAADHNPLVVAVKYVKQI